MLSSNIVLFALIVIVLIVAAAVLPELLEGGDLRRILSRLLFYSVLGVIALAGYVWLVAPAAVEVAELPTPTETPMTGGGGNEPSIIITPIELDAVAGNGSVAEVETAVSPTASPIPPTAPPPSPTSTMPPPPPPTSTPTALPITPIVLTNTPVPPASPTPPPPPPLPPSPTSPPSPSIIGLIPSYGADLLFPPFAVPPGVSTGAADFVSNASVNWERRDPGNSMGRQYSYQRFYQNSGACNASDGLYGFYEQIIYFNDSSGAARFYDWALDNATPNFLVGEQAYTAVSNQAVNGCTVRRYTVAFRRANVFYKVRVLVHTDAAHLVDYAWNYAWTEAYRMDGHLSSLVQ